MIFIIPNWVFGGVILSSEVLTVVPLRGESPLVLFLLWALLCQEELPEVGPSGHIDLEAKAPCVKEFFFLDCT